MTKYKTLEEWLLAMPLSERAFPFGPDVPVFKIMGKMFALVSWNESPLRLNLKCSPDEALVLRAVYRAVTPGYHMNKTHWNSVAMDESVPDEEIKRMIKVSYDLVVSKLTKKEREILSRDVQAKGEQPS